VSAERDAKPAGGAGVSGRSARTWLATPPGFSYRRTVLSHGWYALPPFRLDRSRFTLERVLRVPSGRIVDVRLTEGEPGRGFGLAAPAGLAAADRSAVRAQVRHMLRLDEDYSGFYAAAAAHPPSAWIPRAGAGRLLRSPTVFEDLVKLICTTNCTWSLTEIMVGNLVAALGEPAENGGARAFPTPEAMAGRDAPFYEKEVRAGYRAGALAILAERVAGGTLDVESWLDPSLSTADLTRAILSVRGAGPYTAENLLKLLGRYEGMAIDSWCRAKYLRMYGGSVRRLAAKRAANAAKSGKKSTSAGRGGRARAGRPAKKTARDKAGSASAPAVTPALIDAAIARRYRRFGPWRGLALWCDLTKDWLDGDSPAGGEGDKF